MNKENFCGWAMLIFTWSWAAFWMIGCFMIFYSLRAVAAFFFAGLFSFILAYLFKGAKQEFEREENE